MRLLFISSVGFWGGGEEWMASTCAGLAARGHNVTLVCQPQSPLHLRAEGRGFRVYPIRIRGDLDPIVVLRLAHLMARERIRLVCVNRDKETRLAGLATRLVGLPLIKRRGSDYAFPNRWRFPLTYRLLVDRIIVNSASTRRTLLAGNRWLSPEQLVLIYNGIDLYFPDKPAPLSELRLPPKTGPVVAIVGTLNERKGHRYLLQAMPSLASRFPDTRLWIVGEGKLRSELEAMTEKLNLSAQVNFIGFRDDVRSILPHIDLLVLPSQCEGFGYVLAEAMAVGKPVVATNVSSIPEIVADGRSGLLVPPRDPGALEEAIAQILGDPERARCMGEEGRRIVRERFSIDRMLDEVEALFMEVHNARHKSEKP